MDSSETNIFSFYDELRQLFLNIPDDDKIILLGDLNVRVGRDSQTWKCLGSHGLGKSNSTGLQLLQFWNKHDLIIGKTWFHQKNKYKGTWQHPRSRHWHMIDYVIVHRLDLQDLLQVQAMRGAECWTDHHLVRAKMEFNICPKALHTTTPGAKKLEVSKFSHLPETKNIFQNALTSIELDGTNLWEDFKVKVLSTAQDTLGFRKRKCQDGFAENHEEIDAFLETKHNLFQKTLLTNLSNQAKMEATKAYKDFKKVARTRMCKIQNQ